MRNSFYELPDNIKQIYMYNYDDSEHNKGLYNEVLNELSKKNNRIH